LKGKLVIGVAVVQSEQGGGGAQVTKVTVIVPFKLFAVAQLKRLS
jgi:hypothetical protein